MIKRVTLDLIDKIPEVPSYQSSLSRKSNHSIQSAARRQAEPQEKLVDDRMNENASNLIASDDPSRPILIKQQEGVKQSEQIIEEDKKEEVKSSLIENRTAPFKAKLTD